MNKAQRILTMCESLEYPLPKLPGKYAKTVDGWISYLKDEMSRMSPTAEEAITGDYSKHFFYTLPLGGFSDKKYDNFLKAVRALEEKDYAELYTELPNGDARHELYFLGRKEVDKLLELARQADKGWESPGGMAYSAIQSAMSNAGESDIKGLARYHNDINNHPRFWAMTYSGISSSLDDNKVLADWFRKHGYQW